MKKVGIVTFHKPYNYGANVQAIALQEKLQNMGYNAEIINYRNKKIETKTIKTNFKNLSGKRIAKELVANIVFLRKNMLRKKNFEKFQQKYYNLSKECYSIEDIENEIEEDIYLVGSDQIWNTKITKGIDDVYTLNFKNPNKKRASYASSMGNAVFSSEEEKKELINRLNKFDSLAVREKKAKNLIEKNIDKNVQVTLDPTLLLTGEEWSKLIECKEPPREEYIFVYTIIENKEIFKIANKLSSKTGLKIVTSRRTNGILKNVQENIYTKGPVDFIEGIRNAKYVVTSSFHGTAFSVIFNKTFFNNYGGSENKRVDNLLDVLGIENRYIKNETELNKEMINKQMNYNEINKKLGIEREKSIQYLKGAIEND